MYQNFKISLLSFILSVEGTIKMARLLFEEDPQYSRIIN